MLEVMGQCSRYVELYVIRRTCSNYKLIFVGKKCKNNVNCMLEGAGSQISIRNTIDFRDSRHWERLTAQYRATYLVFASFLLQQFREHRKKKNILLLFYSTIQNIFPLQVFQLVQFSLPVMKTVYVAISFHLFAQIYEDFSYIQFYPVGCPFVHRHD